MTVLDQVRTEAREQIRAHKAAGKYKSAYSVQQLCEMYTALCNLRTHEGEFAADWFVRGLPIRMMRSRLTTTIRSLPRQIAQHEEHHAKEWKNHYAQERAADLKGQLARWQDVKAIIG